MSRRDNVAARCPRCHMHLAMCICPLVPQLVTRARLLLVIHREEERKPTNTGLLAARCLVRSSVVVTGDRARPLPLPLIADGEQALLLFPADDAVPIAQFGGSAKPLVLVVPDGSWRQASKVRARVPGLADVPCVSLPPGPPTTYRLRTERRPGGLATLEAIARAYAALEDPAIGDAMMRVFDVMVERTLRTRGVITSPGSDRAQ